MEEDASYLNYFLEHCPDGVTEVFGNKRLISPAVYTDIDVEYFSNQNGIKCYFVVKPNGDPTGIKLQFNGGSSFNLDGTSNALTINSSVGSVTFDRPTVYQLDNMNDTIHIAGWTPAWQTDGASNKYKFNIGAYDNTKVLVIEIDQGNGSLAPVSGGNLDWSTYYGGGGEIFTDIKTDLAGRSYVTGYTPGNLFPTTTGVIDGTYNGMDDAIVIKFNSDASRAWATYYGGAETDLAGAITTDASGNVYITGSTRSPGFPVLSPFGEYLDASNTCTGGGCLPQDLFVVRLSENGNNVPVTHWATFYGATNGSDRGRDIAIDGANNLFVVGCGDNTTPLVNSGSFNQTTGGGLIMQFNSSRALPWVSFTGGTAAGGNVTGIDFDASNNIYLTGFARGTGYPMLNPGANSSFQGGAFDAVVTRLDAGSHALSWSTYYGGDGDDVSNDIVVEKSTGHSFITGKTSSLTTPLITVNPGSGYYETALQGADDVFIAEFSNTGVMLWSTYYGGTADNEWGEGLALNDNGDLFVTGSVYSSDFPYPASNLTGGYIQGGLEGFVDGFVLAFDWSRANIWATYFGGDGSDISLACATYQDSELYITGSAYSDNTLFPLEPGSGTPYYDDVLSGGSYNGFVSRFDLAQIVSGINEVSTELINFTCYPNPVTDQVNISFSVEEKSQVKIELMDLLGRRLEEKKLGTLSGSINERIDLENYANGIYFIKVTVGNKNISAKVVRQK